MIQDQDIFLFYILYLYTYNPILTNRRWYWYYIECKWINYIYSTSSLPTSSTLYNFRAAAYGKLEQHDLSIQDCRKAVSIDPHYSKAYGRMGWVPGPESQVVGQDFRRRFGLCRAYTVGRSAIGRITVWGQTIWKPKYTSFGLKWTRLMLMYLVFVIYMVGRWQSNGRMGTWTFAHNGTARNYGSKSLSLHIYSVNPFCSLLLLQPGLILSKSLCRSRRCVYEGTWIGARQWKLSE